MQAWLKKKKLVALILTGIFLSLLLLNRSFHLTIARYRAIGETKKELETVNREVTRMKSEVANLETNTPAQENLVRRDLGYIRPGEKEIRFLKAPKKD